MSNIPQPVRGMQSLLGEEADRHAAVVAAFDRVRRLYGFKRVEVPVLEPTAVFARTMGETTDVVSKEMYSFDDRSGDNVTLRPEFTAGIARAFLSEGWQQFIPLKVATHGPAFRYERPQKGRFRQFHQLDAEIIGAAEPQADVEVIAFAAQMLAELGIEGVVLKLNTLGDAESRDRWRAELVEHFASHRTALRSGNLAPQRGCRHAPPCPPPCPPPCLRSRRHSPCRPTASASTACGSRAGMRRWSTSAAHVLDWMPALAACMSIIWMSTATEDALPCTGTTFHERSTAPILSRPPYFLRLPDTRRRAWDWSRVVICRAWISRWRATRRVKCVQACR